MAQNYVNFYKIEKFPGQAFLCPKAIFHGIGPVILGVKYMPLLIFEHYSPAWKIVVVSAETHNLL